MVFYNSNICQQYLIHFSSNKSNHGVLMFIYLQLTNCIQRSFHFKYGKGMCVKQWTEFGFMSETATRNKYFSLISVDRCWKIKSLRSNCLNCVRSCGKCVYVFFIHFVHCHIWYHFFHTFNKPIEWLKSIIRKQKTVLQHQELISCGLV